MNAENFKDLGYANFFIEDYSKAIINYNKALEIDYLQELEDEKIYFKLGVSYHKLNQYSNAINAFNTTIRLDYNERNGENRNKLMGQAYYELKDYFNSIYYYKGYLYDIKG